jgi:hypothetical protein
MRLLSYLFIIPPSIRLERTPLYGDFEDQLCNSIPQLCGSSMEDLKEMDKNNTNITFNDYKSNDNNSNDNNNINKNNNNINNYISIPKEGTINIIKDPPPLTELKVS